MDLGDIQFAYCTEFFVINLKKSTTLADIDKLRGKPDEHRRQRHLHRRSRNDQGACAYQQPRVALTYALELGELDRPKIENMLEQNRALKAKIEAEKKDQGMLAICRARASATSSRISSSTASSKAGRR